MALLQPRDDEVSETTKQYRARDSNADAPDREDSIGSVVFYIVELNVSASPVETGA
jgi:hypothetical protein